MKYREIYLIKFYANLYHVTIFYANQIQFKLNLNFYAFPVFYTVWEACYRSHEMRLLSEKFYSKMKKCKWDASMISAVWGE